MTVVAIGDLAEDLVVRLLVDAESPTSDTPASISRHRGGAASHVAVNLRRLGTRSRFAGVVGDDARGAELRARLESDGVEVVAATIGATATLVVVVARDGGRRFYTDRGGSSDLEQLPAGALDGARWCYVGGYSLCPEPVGPMLRHELDPERRGDLRLFVDPSSVSVVAAYGVDRFRAELAALRPDLVRANAEEAEQLGLYDGIEGGVVVVSDGASPTTIIQGDRRIEVPIRRVPVVVDTTGAGDAQSAGILHALAGGADIVDAVRVGHDASARVVTAVGADAWSVEDPWKTASA